MVSLFGPEGPKCDDHLAAKGCPVFLWRGRGGVVQDAQLTIPSWLNITRLIAEPHLNAGYSSSYTVCCCDQKQLKEEGVRVALYFVVL